MTHKQDLKVISTWKFSQFTVNYVAGEGMIFMGTSGWKKKERSMNGSTMHKYMKPQIPFPVFDRLVSWAQHLFTRNGICVLISPSLPPASDTGPEEWNSCPAQQFGREESLLGAVWGDSERQAFAFLWVWTGCASTAGGWSKWSADSLTPWGPGSWNVPKISKSTQFWMDFWRQNLRTKNYLIKTSRGSGNQSPRGSNFSLDLHYLTFISTKLDR